MPVSQFMEHSNRLKEDLKMDGFITASHSTCNGKDQKHSAMLTLSSLDRARERDFWRLFGLP